MSPNKHDFFLRHVVTFLGGFALGLFFEFLFFLQFYHSSLFFYFGHFVMFLLFGGWDSLFFYFPPLSLLFSLFFLLFDFSDGALV